MTSTYSNPVGRLQEHSQARSEGCPVYQLLETQGPSHCPTFTIQVHYLGSTATATGNSKKAAKSEAARNMLNIINGEEEGREGGEESTEGGSQANIAPPPPPAINTVGDLQELCLVKGLGQPVYEDIGMEGPDHLRIFTVSCKLGSREGEAKGNTKKEAKKKAANIVLEQLRKETEEQRKSSDTEQSEEHENVEKDTDNHKCEENGISNVNEEEECLEKSDESLKTDKNLTSKSDDKELTEKVTAMTAIMTITDELETPQKDIDEKKYSLRERK